MNLNIIWLNNIWVVVEWENKIINIFNRSIWCVNGNGEFYEIIRIYK